MLINWKRRIFIALSVSLCYLDLATDLLFYLQVDHSSTMLGLMLVQPGVYLIYFWLVLIVLVLCQDNSDSILHNIISFCCLGPLFVLLCELKLMLTPLYFLIYHKDTQGDRIKHNLLSHLLVHSLVQSLPMTVYQGLFLVNHLEGSDKIKYISVSVSFAMFLYGIIVLNILRQMNTGGLTWIQKPKPTLQFYSTLPIPFSDFMN